jgi:hypothetical protein
MITQWSVGFMFLVEDLMVDVVKLFLELIGLEPSL